MSLKSWITTSHRSPKTATIASAKRFNDSKAAFCMRTCYDKLFCMSTKKLFTNIKIFETMILMNYSPSEGHVSIRLWSYRRGCIHCDTASMHPYKTRGLFAVLLFLLLRRVSTPAKVTRARPYGYFRL